MRQFLQYVCRMEILFTLQEINEAAAGVYKLGSKHKVWAVHGEMGSGKTTFIHAICENLGVTSGIGSPTYSIINEYKSTVAAVIYHMDWYRLKDEEEAIQAGVEDCLSSGRLCLVEWPERAPALLPDDCFHLKIIAEDQQLRRIATRES